jgi:hypothetical protein
VTQPAHDRQFSVYARHLDGHHARLVRERSFEAAAVAYVEALDPVGGELELKVIVREISSGDEHCFFVDLDTGETAACG